MSRNLWLAMLACALVLLVAAPLFAATQNAVVYGTVYDAAGNPMAGVTVTLDNPAFGFSRTTTTGSDGSYNFAEVPPADGYRVTATLSGRKVDVRSGIAVNVGDERVILPPLKEQAAAPAAPAPGTAPQAPAAAEGPVVHPETVSSAVSGVITRDQLLALPLYNRNFLALGLITPNVHDVEQGSELAGGSFSVSGNRPETNDFLLDGSDNVATSNNQAIPFQVNDSIQEFRVVSANATAEYGRGQGGVVNVVTRRATNSWHGSGYGYFGDQALNADSPLSVYNGSGFDKAAAYAGPVTAGPGAPAGPGFPVAPTTYNQYVATAQANGFCTNSIGLPGGSPCPANFVSGLNTRFDPAAVLATHNSHTIPFSSQQFGFNIGGPIRKDKIFVFGSYEGTRINNPSPIFERVPSSFDRTYDALLARGVPPAVLFPSTDPNFLIANKVLNLYPAANVIGVPDALTFFQGEAPNYTHVHNLLARADWVQSDRSSWSFRYVVQTLNQLHDDTLPSGLAYPGNGSFRNALNQNLNVSFSHTITPTLLNEFHAGFARFRINETAQDKNFPADSLGLPTGAMPTIFLSGLDTQYSGSAPGFLGAYTGWGDSFWFGVGAMMPTLDGLFPMARLGAPLHSPSSTIDMTAFFGDGLSWTKGKHTLKFGGEYRHINDHYFDGSFARGFIVSSDVGEFNSDSATFLGTAFRRPSFDYAQTQSTPYQGTFDHQGIAGYIQDTWRATRRLTINVGVRYEYFSTPSEENNRIWNFDPVAHGLVQQNSTVVQDPFGNVCSGTTLPVYPNSAAPVAALVGILASKPQEWNCSFKGNGSLGAKNTTNFAPRLGMAWDIFGTGRTVLRGGVGWYFDQMPTALVAPLMYNRPSPGPNFGNLATFTNPSTIYGQRFDSGCGFVVCPVPPPVCLQCGNGNQTLNSSNPAFNLAAQGAASPFGMLARDAAHSDTPYTRQASLTVQQQLNNHMVLEAGYVGTQGSNLPVVFNANFNDQWFCATTPPASPFIPRCDINTFYPVFTMTNRGSSTYHSLMARVRGQQWHGLSFNATYVWSKSQDNASTALLPVEPTTLSNFTQFIGLFGPGNPAGLLCYGAAFFTSFAVPANFCPPIQGTPVAGSAALTTTGASPIITSRYLLPQDPNNFLRNDWGNSDFDATHRLVLDYNWQVPGSGTWKGNWMLSGIFIAQSGQPFTIFAGPIFGEINQRVDVTGAVTQNNGNPNAALGTGSLLLPSGPCLATQGGVANDSPFVSGGAPFTGTVFSPCLGNSGRNQFRGPNYFTMDMAVQKGFQVFGEGRMLTLRAEFYNLTDRANFYNPISQLSLDGFNPNPQFGQIKSAKDPRQIQFGVRFTF